MEKPFLSCLKKSSFVKPILLAFGLGIFPGFVAFSRIGSTGENDLISMICAFSAFVFVAWLGVGRLIAWATVGLVAGELRKGDRLFELKLSKLSRWLVNVDDNLNRLPWND